MCEVLPLGKGLAEKVLAMLKGAGDMKGLGVVLTLLLEVLAILNWWGAKRFHSLKGVAQNVLLCHERGGGGDFYHFLAPPSPFY